MIFKKILSVFVLFFPVIGIAQCDDLIPNLINQLHGDRNSDMAVCKIWPADESKTIVVLPLPHNSGENDTYDLDVLFVDSQSGEIMSCSWQPSALESDAIRLTGFTIDTGRYRLNPQTRAFGVRIAYTGSSRANPYSDESLNLYVVQGDKLNKVLDQLSIGYSGGEWDTICNGSFSSSQRTLALDNKITNGYTDLVITEKTSTQIARWVNDDCVESEGKESGKTFRLKYNGNEYPLPEAEKRFN